MALKIQRLQFVWAILFAVQENVPAMSGGMAPFFPRPPELGVTMACITGHTFGSGDSTIKLKPHCGKGCSGEEPKDGDKCVVESGTSGSTFIILSGVCQNMTCKVNNKSEIYKQEMNDSLDTNESSKERIPQLLGCGFTNVQDKMRGYLLSTSCVSCQSQANETKRPDCIKCVRRPSRKISRRMPFKSFALQIL
ncbi:uncharacterized protein LOC120838229 [Ixodes scapularis]|uniref:uncharacterized protein LOC120838229 n=1 Tax=Ixodes scapularis TaxID=6945 RepID=UPI001A9E37A4|nr:uncharacterized protein LOC120838229 [Ixodes scapularis]